MALTDYDKKNLSKDDQAKIQAATDKWNTANASGDKAGMAAAAAEAAAVRNNAGYKTDDRGNYTGSYSPTSSGGGSYGRSPYTNNSQYTVGDYKIGSDYGKQRAEGLGVNQSWTATDGSQWVKEPDGTITVYHNGTKSTNAYKQSDLGTLLQQQMAAGLPSWYVQNTLDERVNKALKDPTLSQYAYDNIYNQANKYIQDQLFKQNQQNAQDGFNQWNQTYDENNVKPTAPKSDPRIDALLNQILNREDFSYDAANDPLYQQYKEMYQREGDRARRDTLAEVASGAGGMNSWAVTAAQQANNNYMAQLNDKIPELYQLAYSMYLDDKESMVQDLGILQDMDNTQYNRYRDTMSDWRNDKQFAYGAYNDAIQQGNWQNTFDYNAMWDKTNFTNENYWKNKEWIANRADVDWEKGNYDTETAESQMKELMKQGIMPRDELIAQAGWNKADVEQYVAAIKAQMVKSSGGGGSRKSGGSSSGGGTNGWGGDDTVDMTDYTVTNNHGDSWVAVSGGGANYRVSYQELYNMVESGQVKEVIDNKKKTITYKKA